MPVLTGRAPVAARLHAAAAAGKRTPACATSRPASARQALGESFAAPVLGSTASLRTVGASRAPAAARRGSLVVRAEAPATPAAAADDEGSFLGVNVTTLKKGTSAPGEGGGV